MAIRYCGNVKLRITIENDGGLVVKATYRVALSIDGTQRETVTVQGEEKGVAIDSPAAFDVIARSAMAFAQESVQEDAEWSDATTFVIRRQP